MENRKCTSISSSREKQFKKELAAAREDITPLATKTRQVIGALARQWYVDLEGVTDKPLPPHEDIPGLAGVKLSATEVNFSRKVQLGKTATVSTNQTLHRVEFALQQNDGIGPFVTSISSEGIVTPTIHALPRELVLKQVTPYSDVEDLVADYAKSTKTGLAITGLASQTIKSAYGIDSQDAELTELFDQWHAVDPDPDVEALLPIAIHKAEQGEPVHIWERYQMPVLEMLQSFKRA